MPYACCPFKRNVCAFSLLKRVSTDHTYRKLARTALQQPSNWRLLPSGQLAQGLRDCRQVIWGHWNSELGARQGNEDKVWTETWQPKQHLLGLRVLALAPAGLARAGNWEAGLWRSLQQVAQESKNQTPQDPRGSRKHCVLPASASNHLCQGRPRRLCSPRSVPHISLVEYRVTYMWVFLRERKNKMGLEIDLSGNEPRKSKNQH